MSITEGFEGKMTDPANLFESCFPQEPVITLLSHARQLEAMLKKHQHSGSILFPRCPECGCPEDLGHTPTCELARLLG